MKRGLRRTRKGVVIKNKMDKTITVKSEQRIRHPKYGKFMKQTTVYKAHDEKNEAKIGDEVEIMETRPLSKTKRWRLLGVTKKSKLG